MWNYSEKVPLTEWVWWLWQNETWWRCDAARPVSCRIPVFRRHRQLLLRVDDRAHSVSCSCGMWELGRNSAEHQQPSRDGLPHQHLVSCHSSYHQTAARLCLCSSKNNHLSLWEYCTFGGQNLRSFDLVNTKFGVGDYVSDITVHAKINNTFARGVRILKCCKISVKFSVFVVLYLYRCTDGVKFSVVHSSTPNFTPLLQPVAPVGQKNLKIALWVT